ncbi:MAG TPA: hypothetical protein VEI97_20475 [bacterium]|nr:hypothetical protein [bacterium]
MHIAVDMDDVVVEFTGFLVECINREYGSQLTLAEINDWHFDPWFNPILGRDWWDWLKTRDWLWAKCPAVPGAIGGLQTLRDGGHRVELLTSKPEWAEWVVWAWAGKWRPPVHRITICGHGSQQKHELTDALLLVDDGWHNLEPWAATGRSAIKFARPWNEGRRARRIWEARDWAQVLHLVKELS